MAKCACGPPKAVRASPATSFKKMMPRTRRVRLPERRRGGESEIGTGGEVDTVTKISKGKPRPYTNRPCNSAVGSIPLSCRPTRRYRFRAIQPSSASRQGRGSDCSAALCKAAKRNHPHRQCRMMNRTQPLQRLRTRSRKAPALAASAIKRHQMPSKNTAACLPRLAASATAKKAGFFFKTSSVRSSWRSWLAAQPRNAGPYSLAQPPAKKLTLTSYF